MILALSMTSLEPSWSFFRRLEDDYGPLHGQSGVPLGVLPAGGRGFRPPSLLRGKVGRLTDGLPILCRIGREAQDVRAKTRVRYASYVVYM